MVSGLPASTVNSPEKPLYASSAWHISESSSSAVSTVGVPPPIYKALILLFAFLSIAEPLLKEKKDLQLALGKAIPEMRKAYKVIENERHYNPRVLNDLFKED